MCDAGSVFFSGYRRDAAYVYVTLYGYLPNLVPCGNLQNTKMAMNRV